VNGLELLDEVRVEKHDALLGRTMVIADNEDVQHPFNELSRYSVRFEMIDEVGVGVLTINYQGKLAAPPASTPSSHNIIIFIMKIVHEVHTKKTKKITSRPYIKLNKRVNFTIKITVSTVTEF